MFYDYKLTKRDEISYCFEGTVDTNIRHRKVYDFF